MNFGLIFVRLSNVDYSPSSPTLVAVNLSSIHTFFTLHDDLVMSQFEIRVSAQGGPVESAQFVGRVALLSRNVRQPDHVLANSFAGHKAEPHQSRANSVELRRLPSDHERNREDELIFQ